jgi:predicted O-methyltransferase YrrM
LNFLSIFKRNLIFKLKKKINIDKDKFQDNIELEELFSFYKTDKANYIKSTKISGHGYTEFYEKHFSSLRNKKLNLLEIGSFSGASAAAFAKYFKDINVFCLDINLTKFIYESKKIHPFGLDISNKKLIEKFFNKIDFCKRVKHFDIIIDDGSHILSDQLKAIDYFFKYLNKDGYYVIEDYRFSEYIPHLKDTDDPCVREFFEILKKNNKKDFKFISAETFENLKKNSPNIFEYKGNKKLSSIAFIKKLN